MLHRTVTKDSSLEFTVNLIVCGPPRLCNNLYGYLVLRLQNFINTYAIMQTLIMIRLINVLSIKQDFSLDLKFNSVCASVSCKYVKIIIFLWKLKNLILKLTDYE